MDGDADSLPARIRKARIAIGMSQTELARALAVNRATIGHWEREKGFAPSVDHLRAMSAVINVSETWLLHGEDQPRGPSCDHTRVGLESKMVSLSRNLPLSFLASVVALLEKAEMYL